MFDATRFIKDAVFAADGIHLAPESGHKVCDAISEALSSHGASPGGSALADEDEGGNTSSLAGRTISFSLNYYAEIAGMLKRQPLPGDKLRSGDATITFAQLTELSGQQLMDAFPITLIVPGLRGDGII